jgi:uncharacterized protein YdhG (YjbR/CyaY superfamily)
MSVIDDYLAKVPLDQRAVLEHIRDTVKQLVPDADEVISYGIPVIKLNGTYLIGFSAFKNHMSLFPGAAAIDALKSQLTGYKTSRGTIQFTLDNPLPESIIQTAVMQRIAAIQAG